MHKCAALARNTAGGVPACSAAAAAAVSVSDSYSAVHCAPCPPRRCSSALCFVRATRGSRQAEGRRANMDRLGSMLRMGGQGMQPDTPAVDTSEQIYISSLALLKMLKHGRAGVPMEVMGLMLGDFVDDYTVRVVDVFAMPQSGTGVSVEAVDPVFQTKMLDMLKQTGRPEMVVGWYHSHPGFGCWLSGACPCSLVVAAGVLGVLALGLPVMLLRDRDATTSDPAGVGDGGRRGCEHAAKFRGAESACSSGCGRPDPVGQGQGGN